MFGRSRKKKSRLGSGVRRPVLNGAGRPRMSRLQWLCVILVMVVLVAAITRFPMPRMGMVDYDIDVGMIAPETIRAEFPFDAVNLQATRDAEEAAATAVPETFRVNSEKVENQLQVLRKRIDFVLAQRQELDNTIRRALKASDSRHATEAVVAQAVADFAAQIVKRPELEGMSDDAALALWLMPTPDSIPKRDFGTLPEGQEAGTVSRPVQTLIEPDRTPLEFSRQNTLVPMTEQGLAYVLTRGVWGKLPAKESQVVAILRDASVGDLKLSEELPAGQIPVMGQASEPFVSAFEHGISGLAARPLSDTDAWPKLQNAAWQMARPFLTDSLEFDQVATDREREKARAAVQPVMKSIQRGEIIQDGGKRWSLQSISDARTYWDKLASGQEPHVRVFGSITGNIILVAIALICLFRAIPLLSPEEQNTVRSLNVALLLMCGVVIVARVAFYFEPTGLLVPVTAGTILLAILTNVRLGALVGLLMAALVSVLYKNDWDLLVVASAMSTSGALSVFRVRRRGDMARAALNATGVGLLTLVAFNLTAHSLFSQAGLQQLFLIVLNGCICLFLVPGLLSPLERLFGITTDMQLLEYSDLNNEVLSQLAIEVPATYAHSLMLGQLAEAAADAIGGNGLLARVCAYYHDIGKLRRPEYFSENQTGVNIHDDLSPRLSARAIASHVLEGAQMAREYRLPKPIIDGILEHHGTNLISFFYQLACEQQKHGDVREEDFRYPGPKPQSRETAILMICDAVESGVRSLKNPTQERVREFVGKIIAARAADHQFDECHLTLKNLDTVAEVVTKRVLTGLHTRIPYPEKEKEVKGQESNVIPLPGGRS